MTGTDTHRAIDAVFRIEWAKLIAGLSRMVRDVGLAEELAQRAALLTRNERERQLLLDRAAARAGCRARANVAGTAGRDDRG